jgi:glucose-6-phosphate dehydrogenase assembly protein OpcA
MIMNTAEPATGDRYHSGSSLEIVQIERELQKLWKDAGETSSKSGGGPVVRACSMTLVAPCSNDLQFDHVAQTVEQVSVRQASRAILVRVDLDRPDRQLDAHVSMVCSAGGPQQKRLCHEQIQLFSTAGSMDGVAPTVLSLLVPDVPAYMWAPCEKLLATQMIEDLAGHADALILDSHRFSEPFKALENATRIAQNHRANRAIENAAQSLDAGHGFGILDLDWKRLDVWFDAVSTAFEPLRARNLVKDLVSVKITYTSKSSASGESTRRGGTSRELITPALLAGWLASRLGWSAEGRVARTTPVSSDLRLEKSGARNISLVPRFENDRPGSILEVALTATMGTITIRRMPGAEMGSIHYDHFKPASNAPPQISARLQSMNDTEALWRALSMAPRDLAFERALPVAMAFRRKNS